MELMTLLVVSVLVPSILGFAYFVQARSQAAGRKGERRLATLGLSLSGYVAAVMGILLVLEGTEATRASEAGAWLAWVFAVILAGGLLLGGTVVVRSARAEATALREGTEPPAKGPLLLQGLISVILVTVGVVGLIQF